MRLNEHGVKIGRLTVPLATAKTIANEFRSVNAPLTLIDWKAYAQKRPYWCGPATMRIVEALCSFWVYPENWPCHSQAYWAKVMGTSVRGTDEAKLEKGLAHLGRLFQDKDPVGEVWVAYDLTRHHWLTWYNGYIIDSSPESGKEALMTYQQYKLAYGNKPMLSYPVEFDSTLPT